MPVPDPLLAKLDDGQLFLASRSSAAAWLEQNRDALVARFKGHRVDWKALATAMAAAGLCDGRGNPPNPRNLPRVWARIRGSTLTELR